MFHSQENGHADFGRFHRLQLKNEALKLSCHKENTRILSKSAKSSSSRSRRSGRPSKPNVFGRQYQKNRILKPTKNRRQSAEKVPKEYALSYQVIPSYGNAQMRRTFFESYLFKYCSVKYQTFHQVPEKTFRQTYSHQKLPEKLSRCLQEP